MTAPDSDRQALRRAGDHRHPAFLRFFRHVARNRIAHRLDGLWVAGLEGARAALSAGPVLFAANHVAWWDALLLLPLDEALGSLGWAVMDSRNLQKLPFFGWIGALPLDRSSPERSRECLKASAALLDRPGRGLWIFPQGRQRPAHLRPLDLRPGVQTMYASNPVTVIAVSIDYVFMEKARPAAVVRFSPPLSVQSGQVIPAVEAGLLAGLAEIDAATLAATDGRRARTHPDDPLPGFTALVRRARLVPRRGGPRAG